MNFEWAFGIVGTYFTIAGFVLGWFAKTIAVDNKTQPQKENLNESK